MFNLKDRRSIDESRWCWACEKRVNKSHESNSQFYFNLSFNKDVNDFYLFLNPLRTQLTSIWNNHVRKKGWSLPRKNKKMTHIKNFGLKKIKELYQNYYSYYKIKIKFGYMNVLFNVGCERIIRKTWILRQM